MAGCADLVRDRGSQTETAGDTESWRVERGDQWWLVTRGWRGGGHWTAALRPVTAMCEPGARLRGPLCTALLLTDTARHWPLSYIYAACFAGPN